MEHRFNRKQCHTELATFIVQRSITEPVESERLVCYRKGD